MPHVSFSSPVGDLTLFSDGNAITSLCWDRVPDQATTLLLGEAKDQVLAYFHDDLRVFDLPLAPKGTEFQARVWSLMQDIPFGEVRTYGALAQDLESGARPVGTACGANPIPIIIPCHRVVATHGRGGYSGGQGLVTKQALLDLEGQQLQLV